jgi:hypothetical protein
MSDQAHWVEVNRLWGAIKRDYLAAVEIMAGFRPLDDAAQARSKRIRRNWDGLCDLDIDVAARLHHGFEQMWMGLSRRGNPNDPVEHHMRQLKEVVGIATIGRDANPDTDVGTLGELIQMGEDAIRKQIDDDLADRGEENAQ